MVESTITKYLDLHKTPIDTTRHLDISLWVQIGFVAVLQIFYPYMNLDNYNKGVFDGLL